MNILNGSEMLTAQDAAYFLLVEVEDAETLLRCAWSRFFGDAEQNLTAGDAMELGVLLRVCCDRINSAILSYRLSVGQDGPGVAQYFEQAADYQAARELQDLDTELLKKRVWLSGAAADALMAQRMEALRLPIPDGIKLLQKLNKQGGSAALLNKETEV